MSKLNYEDLKPRKYLENKEIKLNKKIQVFKYMTRMLMFGENFRGGLNETICPLFFTHKDSQDLAFTCPEIRRHLDISANIEDIYNEDISLKHVDSIRKFRSFKIFRDESIYLNCCYAQVPLNEDVEKTSNT